MKKLTIAIASCMLLCTLCSCNSETSSESTDVNIESESSLTTDVSETDNSTTTTEPVDYGNESAQFMAWKDTCKGTSLPVITDSSAVLEVINSVPDTNKQKLEVEAPAELKDSVSSWFIWTDPYFLWYDPSSVDSKYVSQSVATIYTNTSDKDLCIEALSGDVTAYIGILPAHTSVSAVQGGMSVTPDALAGLDELNLVVAELTPELYTQMVEDTNEYFSVSENAFPQDFNKYIQVHRAKYEFEYEVIIDNPYSASVYISNYSDWLNTINSVVTDNSEVYNGYNIMYFGNNKLTDLYADAIKSSDLSGDKYKNCDGASTGYGEAEKVIILPCLGTSIT